MYVPIICLERKFTVITIAVRFIVTGLIKNYRITYVNTVTLSDWFLIITRLQPCQAFREFLCIQFQIDLFINLRRLRYNVFKCCLVRKDAILFLNTYKITMTRNCLHLRMFFLLFLSLVKLRISAVRHVVKNY